MAAASFPNVPTPKNVLEEFEDWAILARGNAIWPSSIPDPTTDNEEDRIVFVAAVLKTVKEVAAVTSKDINVSPQYLEGFYDKAKASTEHAAFAQKVLDRLAKK